MKLHSLICHVFFIVATLTMLEAVVNAQSKVRGGAFNRSSRETERRTLKMSKADRHSDCQRRNLKGKKNIFDELQDCIFVGADTSANNSTDAEIGKGKGKGGKKRKSKGGKGSKSGNDRPKPSPTHSTQGISLQPTSLNSTAVPAPPPQPSSGEREIVPSLASPSTMPSSMPTLDSTLTNNTMDSPATLTTTTSAPGSGSTEAPTVAPTTAQNNSTPVSASPLTAAPTSAPTTAPTMEPTHASTTAPVNTANATTTAATSPATTAAINATTNDVPTNIPTNAPTIVQENVATTAPANVATIIPTNSTTPAPTNSPIDVTSPQPTTFDNVFRAPTSSSSSSPSHLPSRNPSVAPSKSNRSGQPTLACLPESNGDFGKETSTTTRHELSFVYEIEVFPNVNADIVNNQILARVENRASRALIPALFSAQCGGTRRLQEGVQAMKASPADKVIDGIKCTGNRINEANNCFVVDGKMILIMDGGDSDKDVATSKTTIRAAMDGGDFNTLDQRVAGITYRSDTNIQTDIATSKGSPESGSVGSKIPVFGWILIGFGSFMLAVLLCCCFRSRASRNHGVDYYPRMDTSPQQVDPLVQGQSSDYYPSPSWGGGAMSSAQIYNDPSNARPPSSIYRAPSFSSSANDMIQRSRMGQVDYAGHSVQDSSVTGRSELSSQEKKPATQRAVFPGAQYPGASYAMGAPPPVKQVQTEELLIASSNYADMHQSSASMGIIPPANESIDHSDEGDDQDAEEGSYASASESDRSSIIEGVSQESTFQDKPESDDHDDEEDSFESASESDRSSILEGSSQESTFQDEPEYEERLSPALSHPSAN